MRLAIISMLAAALVGCSRTEDAAPVHPVADLVLTNGNVLTVDAARPNASAIAITGDRITAVGTVAEIAPYIGDATDVVDLAGQTARVDQGAARSICPDTSNRRSSRP